MLEKILNIIKKNSLNKIENYLNKFILRQKLSKYLVTKSPITYIKYIGLSYFKSLFPFGFAITGFIYGDDIFKFFKLKFNLVYSVEKNYVILLVVLLASQGAYTLLNKVHDDLLRNLAQYKDLLLPFEQILYNNHKGSLCFLSYIEKINQRCVSSFSPLYLLPSNASLYALVLNRDLLFTSVSQQVYNEHMENFKRQIQQNFEQQKLYEQVTVQKVSRNKLL